MERFINILKASGADGWEVCCEKTKGWEFYFIGHRLDQNRAKDIETITLKVYKKIEDGKFLGFATAEVAPTASDAEIKKAVDELIYKASLVRNKPYKLVQPRAFEPLKTEPAPLAEEAGRFITAFNEMPETDTEDLNSFEIFTDIVERRLITSEGIDVTENYPSSQVEIVVNARRDEHEIELYRLYELGACDAEGLRRDVSELLRFGKDRLRTVPTPKLENVPVILSTDAALEVYRFFLGAMNTAYVVRKMSPFEIGKPFAEEISGDRLTIDALRFLDKSPRNFSCDSEGSPIRDMCLVKDSVPQNYWGGRMFSQYLGLEDSFNISNWAVKGGSLSAEELRKGPYLEIVEFSDFQVDDMTGDIFGEIRLAYYCDGEKVIPVTGGSVSGSMLDNLADMRMSIETRRYSNAVIPSGTKLNHITIAGV